MSEINMVDTMLSNLVCTMKVPKIKPGKGRGKMREMRE